MHYADGMSFAVFDGMGGAAYSKVASEIAVQTLRKYEKKLKHADGTRMLDQLISSYTSEANNAICDMLTESTARTAELLSPCSTFSVMQSSCITWVTAGSTGIRAAT
ncbi:MAG: protein phosphatase 2C domain-containing protein [Ruminococcus sp.]